MSDFIRVWLDCAAPCASLGEGGRPRSILGTAMTFGETRPYGIGTMTFQPGSFDRKDVFADVVLNANRHGGSPLARTTAGTMTLKADKKRVQYAAKVDFEDTEYANVYRRVKSGVIDGASMGLLFELDGVTYEVDEENGDVHQVVNSVAEVFEVTLTHQPVFRRTSASTGTGLMEPPPRVYSATDSTADLLAQLPEDVRLKRDEVLAKMDKDGSKRSGKAPDFKARALARRPTRGGS